MKNELYYCPSCGFFASKMCIENRPQYGICPICNIKLIPSGYDDDMLIELGNLARNCHYSLIEQVFIDHVVKPNPQFNPEKHEEYLRYSNAVVAELKAKRAEEERLQELEDRNKVKCPRCGSTQIQMVQRKWSFWTGFLTNKVDRVCVKCKHRW